MQQILTDNTNQVYYVIKVNGVIVSQKFQDRSVAEMQKLNLTPEQQTQAIVEAVTADNKQVLFG